jgi:hypothetical protein
MYEAEAAWSWNSSSGAVAAGWYVLLRKMRRTIETAGRLRAEDVPHELKERLLAAFESWTND